jgi:2-polyprenyl-3-methyl-5-hydroxy-6-metoxy-1,4-benzoquinol methylase
MSKQQWDSRYSADEYIYGTRPNAYLEQSLLKLSPGSILFPGEGEGRNSVFAATLGWQADAFDQSEAGKQKALKLADLKSVKINYNINSIEDWQPGEKLYDCIALIFIHMPPALRAAFHAKMIAALKPGGVIVLEAFSKKQLPRGSGGPKDPDMLYDADDIRQDFASMNIKYFAETLTDLDEGPLHSGLAEVVRMTAIKAS